MPRDGGKVQIAALRHFADRTGPATFGDAREQSHTDGIAEGLEQVRGQKVVQCATAGARLTGRGGSSAGRRRLVAYLHHDASIAPPPFLYKSVRALRLSHRYRKVVRLVESPYFGRIDLADDGGSHARPAYIRLGIPVKPSETLDAGRVGRERWMDGRKVDLCGVPPGYHSLLTAAGPPA